MTHMRKLINLIEDFGGPVSSGKMSMIWNNARVLQSQLKYLDTDPAMLARLNASFDVVMGYLDELHRTK